MPIKQVVRLCLNVDTILEVVKGALMKKSESSPISILPFSTYPNIREHFWSLKIRILSTLVCIRLWLILQQRMSLWRKYFILTGLLESTSTNYFNNLRRLGSSIYAHGMTQKLDKFSCGYSPFRHFTSNSESIKSSFSSSSHGQR